MLEFIVLGQIPGTNIRLPFTAVLLLLLTAVIGVNRVISRQRKAKENN